MWADQRFSRFCVHGFMAPKYLHPGSLLFVGINPSYSKADEGLSYYDPRESQHPYYRPFKIFAQEVGEPSWTHFDMLFHRETAQAAIEPLLKQPNGRDFVWEQLQLSQQLLMYAQPKVIVVCNTKAREFLGLDKDHGSGKKAWLDLNFEWDESLGTFRYQGVPTFFSGMLSGQRALDKGSHRRLIWHVRNALRGLSTPALCL